MRFATNSEGSLRICNRWSKTSAGARGPRHRTICRGRFFHLFTDLIEADVSEELARELIERLRGESPTDDFSDEMLAKARIARLVEEEIRVTGPIRMQPGKRRLVALVGPTGVGKTTTIAKLAANFRLKEKRRVGLITVDTYRIAAVEQLRTYADIIDLPMAVVSTPREMREAVARMNDLELILMDTAGRSPRDEVKIQELKSMLSEAGADEVHLVLSSTAGAASLVRTAEQFAAVGTTALVLTKLDEVSGLGNLLPLLRSTQIAVELRDRRTECSRRYRTGRQPSAGADGFGDGGVRTSHHARSVSEVSEEVKPGCRANASPVFRHPKPILGNWSCDPRCTIKLMNCDCSLGNGPLNLSRQATRRERSSFPQAKGASARPRSPSTWPSRWPGKAAAQCSSTRISAAPMLPCSAASNHATRSPTCSRAGDPCMRYCSRVRPESSSCRGFGPLARFPIVRHPLSSDCCASWIN